MKRFTVAHHLQSLVPHAMPADGVASLLGGLFSESPSAAVSLAALAAILVTSLALAMRAVEAREYVLDQ